jgi:cytochrome c5
MKRTKLILGCLAFGAAAVVGQTSTTPPQQTSPARNAGHVAKAVNSQRGEQVFHQNCARCHQEPEGFSPSISETIARHMRVRAGLSEDDYKALLKFLNP